MQCFKPVEGLSFQQYKLSSHSYFLISSEHVRKYLLSDKPKTIAYVKLYWISIGKHYRLT